MSKEADGGLVRGRKESLQPVMAVRSNKDPRFTRRVRLMGVSSSTLVGDGVL